MPTLEAPTLRGKHRPLLCFHCKAPLQNGTTECWSCGKVYPPAFLLAKIPEKRRTYLIDVIEDDHRRAYMAGRSEEEVRAVEDRMYEKTDRHDLEEHWRLVEEMPPIRRWECRECHTGFYTDDDEDWMDAVPSSYTCPSCAEDGKWSPLMPEGSEFGAGIVVCLAKFGEHLGGGWMWDRLRDMRYLVGFPVERRAGEAAKQGGSMPATLRSYEISRDIYGRGRADADVHAVSHEIEMWMNGASDHMYDVDVKLAPEALRELRELTLTIGHGFTSRVWTWDTVDRIFELYRKACLEVDMMLGTAPDWGKW